MRSEVCERPACRQRDDESRLRTERELMRERLRQQLAPGLGDTRAASARVLWIVPHAAHLVELDGDLREQHRQHLLQLATEGATVAAAAPASQAGPLAPAEDALCGWCSGRCCRFGRGGRAYLQAGHLRRWQADHAGSSLQDAVDAYLERLPARHVEDSCVYHAEFGCTLDRNMRSEICNRFACDGLRELQARPADEIAADSLFVMGERAQVMHTRLFSPAAGAAIPPTEEG